MSRGLGAEMTIRAERAGLIGQPIPTLLVSTLTTTCAFAACAALSTAFASSGSARGSGSCFDGVGGGSVRLLSTPIVWDGLARRDKRLLISITLFELFGRASTMLLVTWWVSFGTFAVRSVTRERITQHHGFGLLPLG